MKANSGIEGGMEMQHERILQIIGDLAEVGREVDEFSVALACGAISPKLPRHAWAHHPCRGDLLHIITSLDQEKLIYVTKRGYWGMYLTKRGQQAITALAAAPESELLLSPSNTVTLPATEEAQSAWVAPRPTSLPFAPRQDHFYSTLALAVAGLGALLIFAFGQSAYSPLAGDSAAAPISSSGPPPTIVLPIAPTATPTPSTTPAATVAKLYVVANTGGQGVFLRRAPKTGERLAAWPEETRLEEVGPAQQIDGLSWLHVRAPDNSIGYLLAQYTTPVP